MLDGSAGCWMGVLDVGWRSLMILNFCNFSINNEKGEAMALWLNLVQFDDPPKYL